MFLLFRRYLSVLLAMFFLGALAACTTTTTGSDTARVSSIETPAATEQGADESAGVPDEQALEEQMLDEPAQAVAPPSDVQAQPEPAVPAEEMDTTLEMDTIVEDVATGAAPQADVVEGIEEFPIQPYEIDEPLAMDEPLEIEAESRIDPEIARLREELAATESELERIRAEEEQREYSTEPSIAEGDYADDSLIAGVEPAAGEVAGIPPEETATTQVPGAPGDRANIADLSGRPAESSIYFGYDRATVESQFESVLVAHAEFMKANPQLNVEIQGNCDERGSREYNIALGQQRALSVKRALELLGVEGRRIETVSFGAEKPVAFGHDEDSWRLNRRADIVYN